jgi:hypothetical protein
MYDGSGQEKGLPPKPQYCNIIRGKFISVESQDGEQTALRHETHLQTLQAIVRSGWNEARQLVEAQITETNKNWNRARQIILNQA